MISDGNINHDMGYKILPDDTREYAGVTLYRIKSTKNIGIIQSGTLGGYISKDVIINTLVGNTWVYEDSIVVGAVLVEDSCVINSVVYNNSNCNYEIRNSLLVSSNIINCIELKCFTSFIINSNVIGTKSVNLYNSIINHSYITNCNMQLLFVKLDSSYISKDVDCGFPHDHNHRYRRTDKLSISNMFLEDSNDLQFFKYTWTRDYIHNTDIEAVLYTKMKCINQSEPDYHCTIQIYNSSTGERLKNYDLTNIAMVLEKILELSEFMIHETMIHLISKLAKVITSMIEPVGNSDSNNKEYQTIFKKGD